MKILYGQQGKPVGSIEEPALYDRVGRQIGELHDGHIFFTLDSRDTVKGQFAGTFVNGVIFNNRGYPQAFTVDAKRTVPLLPPKVTSFLVNRCSSLGPDVQEESPKEIPQFLRETLAGQSKLVDGLFS